MTPSVIRVDYEQLHELSRRMQGQVEVCGEVRQRLIQALTPLQQGGWCGRGAAAFFLEMDNDLFPALNRLETALTEGRSVLDQIVLVFRAAEEEASRPFQTITAVQSEAHVGDHGGDAAQLTPEDLARDGTDTDTLFSHTYMKDTIDATYPGAGSPALRKAMYLLRGDPSPAEVEWALNVIAEQRGLKDLAEVRRQYEEFKILRAWAEVHGKEEIAELRQIHADYMGSHDHLRFGKIVGDAFGIDPVFGALLNPTGGMVGPNNIALPGNDTAPGYHAAFHDAGGFLYNNFQEMGPGYDYLGEESHRPTSDAFTGQESGIRYWTIMITGDKIADMMNDPTPMNHASLIYEKIIARVSRPISDFLGDLVDVKTELQQAQETATQVVHDTVQHVQETATQVMHDTVRHGADMARNALEQELQKYRRFVGAFL